MESGTILRLAGVVNLILVLFEVTGVPGSKTCSNHVTSFLSICMEFGILLILVGVLNLIPFLIRIFSFQGREPCL